MNKAALLAIALNFIALPVYAENWVYVGRYLNTQGRGDRKAYVDIDSIKISGFRKAFIFKQLYTEGQSTYIDKLFYTRVFIQRLVNCSEGTYTDLSWIYQDWNGVTVNSDAYIQVPRMKQTIPGTFADDILKVACDGYSTAVEPPSFSNVPQFSSSVPSTQATLSGEIILPKKMISENKNTSIFFKGSSLLYRSNKPSLSTGWIQIHKRTEDTFFGQFFDNVSKGIGCKGRIKLTKKNSSEYISEWEVDGSVSSSAKCLESGKQYVFSLDSSG